MQTKCDERSDGAVWVLLLIIREEKECINLAGGDLCILLLEECIEALRSVLRRGWQDILEWVNSALTHSESA
jgi:hypothetical protein